MTETLGTKLTAEAKRQVLAEYYHRFTGEHKPAWAERPRPDGSAHPVRFKDDTDWLANTYFQTTKSGGLDMRSRYCRSNPTWPTQS